MEKKHELIEDLGKQRLRKAITSFPKVVRKLVRLGRTKKMQYTTNKQ